MPDQRSLSVRVILDGRSQAEEDAVLAAVKALLAKLAGDPRPRLEVGRATQEAVAASPTP